MHSWVPEGTLPSYMVRVAFSPRSLFLDVARIAMFVSECVSVRVFVWKWEWKWESEGKVRRVLIVLCMITLSR